MSKLFTVLVLLLSIKLSAQDLNSLKAQDTLYFVLEKLNSVSTTNQSFEKFDLTRYSNGIITEYILSEKDTANQKIFITIRLNPLKPAEDLPLTLNKKGFLKKNQNCLIGINIIKQYTPEELFFGYFGLTAYAPLKRVIYVIDEDSLKRKDKNITLRKATIISIGYLRI